MGSPELVVRRNKRRDACSTILTTPEEIVRQHRIKSMRRRLDSLRPEEKGPGIFERIIKIFFWLVLGWAIGYLHHFLVAR
jgi:hypothetical protein